MEKSCRKWTPKSSPRTLFHFGNNPKQSLHARNSQGENYQKEDYQKALKN